MGRGSRGARNLSVRGVLRATPDLDSIASTVAALAIAQAETEAQKAAEDAAKAPKEPQS